MRIGILLTSNDDTAFARKFPNDGIHFRNLLAPLVPEWEFDIIRAFENQLPNSVKDHDGYIITGSPASVNDDVIWIRSLEEFVRHLDRAEVPTVGCCFGHQMIAKALGGTVTISPLGLTLGTCSTEYWTRMSWNPDGVTHVNLFSAHSEHVSELPDRAVACGRSSSTPYASFVVENHVLTTQYHPEMTFQFMDELIDYMAENGNISPELRTQAKQSIQLPNEGTVFASLMVNFFEHANHNTGS